MEKEYKNNTRHQIRYEMLNKMGIKDINKWEKDNGKDKRYNFNLWSNNWIKAAMKILEIKPAGKHPINGKYIEYFEEEDMKRILDYIIPKVDQFFYTPKRIVEELGNHGYKNERSAMTRATRIAKELGIEPENNGKPYLYGPEDAERIKEKMNSRYKYNKAEVENENIQMQIDEPEDVTELEEKVPLHLEVSSKEKDILDSISHQYNISIVEYLMGLVGKDTNINVTSELLERRK